MEYYVSNGRREAPVAVVVSLDAGTTGVRAIAVDDTSRITGIAYQEFPQYYPRPGWVEHDASKIWEAIRRVIARLVSDLNQPVAAVGITNQRETIVAWDRRTGEPLAPAIVWQDRRTADRCQELTDAGHLERVVELTGLGLDPYFSGTKIAWMLRHGGLVNDANLALGTIDSWLTYKLSGGTAHVTEPSNACRTLLFDIDRVKWSEELCDLLGVPIGALPEVHPTSGRFALTADTTALGAGVPISGMAGDQQAALFGQACFDPGMTKNTFGTGSFILMNVGQARPGPVPGLLTTLAWQLDPSQPPVYAYEGSVFVTGAAIKWLRDGLGIIDSSDEVGPLAASVENTGDVYLVPAFAGLGSPWWDPNARGTIIGITGGTGRAEIARAVVESMAYQVRGVVDLMTASAGYTIAEMRVDGGASVMDLLLQIQADQLGVPVTRPATTETTALGAAYLAGLAEGVWGSTDEVATAWSLDRTFQPAPDRAGANRRYQRWTSAAERSLGWAKDS